MTDGLQNRVRDAERRRYPRFDSDCVFKFSHEGGNQAVNIARIVNVSGTGARFASRSVMQLNTVLQMDLDGSHDQGPVKLRGRVVWVDSLPDARGLYYLGVDFLDIGDAVRPLILIATT